MRKKVHAWHRQKNNSASPVATLDLWYGVSTEGRPGLWYHTRTTDAHIHGVTKTRRSARRTMMVVDTTQHRDTTRTHAQCAQ